MRGLEIAVAGCGPCGLASALLLTRDGHRVTVFERFDSPGPVGSGLMLQPVGLAVLEELGLDARAIAEGARIDRLYGRAGNRIVLDVRYAALRQPGRFGVGIHRASLFSVLFDAARASEICFETGRTIVASAPAGSGRRLVFAEGGCWQRFDLVVDALGARSPLSRAGRDLAYGALWTTLPWPEGGGFDPHALTQRYRRSSTMAGVLPVGGGADGKARAAFFWSLRHDDLAEWQARGMGPWKAEVTALWPECAQLLDAIASPEQMTFAHYAHRTLRAPAEPGLIHIGDAWHSTSPQLGQGANLALLDAWALAMALRDALTVDQALSETVRLRRPHIELYQALSHLFTPVYQSDSRVLPVIRDLVVGPLSKLWPATAIQAAMVGGLIGSPLEPLGLA